MMRMKFLFRVFLVTVAIAFAGHELPAQINVIPMPENYSPGSSAFELNDATIVAANPYAMAEAKFLADWLSQATGRSFSIVNMDSMPQSNVIVLSCTKRKIDLTPERLKVMPDSMARRVLQADKSAYRMNVSARGIFVNAEYDEGVFYAVQTLRQLLPAQAEEKKLTLPLSIKGALISDKARFEHRGLLLDCCRHFMSVDFIKNYIDALAYYKMNVLHWHLTEDQGWRIQIDRYPLLTEIGAWRIEKDGTRYGGFYTKEEIRDIVAYAQKRHVVIIPEIELPGHSSAAIAAYPELGCTHAKIEVENEWGVFKDIYCAGDDGTFDFLENVLEEVCELFPSPYIHIGGDEAPKYRWENCDRCQKRIKDEGLKNEAELQTYFIERIAKFLESKHKRIIGWDEILEGGIPADAMVQSWRGMEGGEHAAQESHAVVMSPTSHCYFDYGLAATDLREVYSFDPIPESLTPSQKQFIKGGECNMWTEHAPQELVDGKVFPRLLALAEVLWTYPDQRNYDAFYLRVEKHYAILKAMGITAGFPTVPMDVTVRPGEYSAMVVEINKNISNAVVSVKENDKGDFEPYVDPIALTEPTTLEWQVEMDGRSYPEVLKWSYDPHLGWNKNIKLAYIPSPYYTGGGEHAMNDGRLGTPNFRDGIWQAAQGVDMSAVIDLGNAQRVESLSSNWFHYGNAWIFLPLQVDYAISDDGENWQSVGIATSDLNEKTPGEFPVPFELKLPKPVSARYVRMIAKNHGVCPTWHDAPGEPSWLFCDEFVIH
jgi:hexosaminidase